MRTKAIELAEKRNVSDEARKAIPEFQAGDTLRVHTKVREGEKERIQIFEGICIRKRKNGTSSSFTVRKISYGVGVERIFPLFSPRIEKIEKLQSSEVSRARLYFLRELAGKKARLRARDDSEREAPAAAAPAPVAPPAPAAPPATPAAS
jgi:large subunit ribosomal protein L19